MNLDCKLKSDSIRPKLDKTDRKNLAKSLSAFANSDGGVLLWGVDAREEEGVDRLRDKRPIAQIATFRNDVERAIADLVSPPVADLEFLEIISNETEESGYLAILVPVSERRPHMSRENGEPGFYFRNGHSRALMEVYQVRDQMLRRTAPRLEFTWQVRVRREHLSRRNAERSVVPVWLDLILEERFFRLSSIPLFDHEDRSRRYLGMGLQYKELGEKGLHLMTIGPVSKRQIVVEPRSISIDWEFTGGADCCIHPGTSLTVAGVAIEAPAKLNTVYVNSILDGQFLEPRYDELPPVIMEVRFGCLNSSRQTIALELRGSEMLAKPCQAERAVGPVPVPQESGPPGGPAGARHTETLPRLPNSLTASVRRIAPRHHRPDRGAGADGALCHRIRHRVSRAQPGRE